MPKLKCLYLSRDYHEENWGVCDGKNMNLLARYPSDVSVSIVIGQDCRQKERHPFRVELVTPKWRPYFMSTTHQYPYSTTGPLP